MDETEYQAELERRLSAIESDPSNIGEDMDSKSYVWMLLLGIGGSLLLVLWGGLS
jgi:hypothetical protein